MLIFDLQLQACFRTGLFQDGHSLTLTHHNLYLTSLHHFKILCHTITSVVCERQAGVRKTASLKNVFVFCRVKTTTVKMLITLIFLSAFKFESFLLASSICLFVSIFLFYSLLVGL